MMLKVSALVFSLCTVGTGAGHAQNWPAKPVKWFLAASTGSAPDIVARLLADRLNPLWGQPIIIDNRPSAGGIAGTAAAAQAEPDGHNLLFAQAAPIVSSQFLFKAMPYNPEKDFVPIVNLGISPMMLAINPSLKANNLAELVALARAEPGKLSYATPASRNVPHMVGELLATMTGIRMLNVPYKTTPQAASDTLAGITQIYINGVPTMMPFISGGKLRVVAVSSLRRLPNFPDIPAISEVAPGFLMVGWFGLMAPARTSPEVRARVNRDTNAVLKNPAVAERMLQLGMYEPGGTAEEFGRFITEERARWASAVKAAGLEPE